MGKPSAAFTHDELCDEFDWMYEFNSRMAERIRNDPDVHNLAAYVEKLEGQNKELRELIAKYSAAARYLCGFSHCSECNLDCASVFGDVPSGWDCARMLLDKKARELGAEVVA